LFHVYSKSDEYRKIGCDKIIIYGAQYLKKKCFKGFIGSVLSENLLYLSSKKVFAVDMTAKFEKFGFVNYMDTAVKSRKTMVTKCSVCSKT